MIVSDLAKFNEDVCKLEMRWKARERLIGDTFSDETWYELETLSFDCDKLIKRQEQLESNCIFLQVKFQESEALQHLCMDIKSHEEVKEVMNNFNNQETNLLGKKWKNFDINWLRDFLTSWQSRVEGLISIKVLEQIRNKLSFLEQCIPVLTYCHGEVYKDEHWATLYYNIFCLPRKIPLKDVTLSDLIQGKVDLLASGTLASIQELQRR